jgi:predicted ATP-dependent Lon-type protease
MIATSKIMRNCLCGGIWCIIDMEYDYDENTLKKVRSD